MNSLSLIFFSLILFSITLPKKHCLYQNHKLMTTVILLTLLFVTLSVTTQPPRYLFTLWWMSFLLSLTDYLFLTVAPLILYPLTCLASYYYILLTPISIISFIEPIFIFIFFFTLEFYLANAIGDGDVILLMIYSFFLPILQLLYLVLIASLLGILFLFSSQFFYHKQIKHLPFVPFLTISLIVTSLYFQ